MSNAAVTPDFNMAAAPEATIDVMALPCIDDFAPPPARADVPLPRRDRARTRQEAPGAVASRSEVDFSAVFAEASAFRQRGGLEQVRAEMAAIGQEFLARGGKLVNNAETRRLLRDITSKLPPRS